ncbi:MAG TPA: SRPBCC family protein [Armatimonadota bacterium]|nr:SRPBCC family protein [Armatimonadota bacterium]
MPVVNVSEEKVIAAPAEKVYACLTDYERHHGKILPPSFSNYRVEQGGLGAGTIVSFQMAARGRMRTFRMQVDEPKPGETLRETDTNSSLVTNFTVTPQDGGCRVRIDTRWKGASGIGGVMERFFAPRALGKIYVDELARLDEYVRSLPPDAAG